MEVKDKAEKIATIAAGHTMSLIINNWFDYGIYVPVIAYFGPVKGGGIMIVLSILINLILIYLYDKTGKDWLGFEMIKEGKEEAASKLPNWLKKAINAGDIMAFIGLSIYDPFFATIYLRKIENKFNGLTKRDWIIFIIATILSNIGWTALVYSGISVFKIIYNFIV